MSPFTLFAPVFFIGVVNIGVVIWALVDAVRVENDSMYQSGNKLVWVLVIVLLGFVGAIVYFVIGKPKPVAGPSRSVPSPPPGALPPPPGR